jgi:hypothetical protein
MGIFNSRKKMQESRIRPESIASGFGIMFIQVLTFCETQNGFTSPQIRKMWAPVMAATTRAAGESTDLILHLYRSNLGHPFPQVTEAVDLEIREKTENLYDPITNLWSQRLMSLKEQIVEQGYKSALKQAQLSGAVNKDLQMKFLIAVFEEFANSCGLPLADEDDTYIQLLSMAGAQHFDDLWNNLPEYGIDNSHVFMQIGAVVIATSLVLYLMNVSVSS